MDAPFRWGCIPQRRNSIPFPNGEYIIMTNWYPIKHEQSYLSITKWIILQCFSVSKARTILIFFIYIFPENVRILCLSCNIKKSKTPAKLSANNWNKCRSNRFQCYLRRQSLYCFFLSINMNQVPKPNNTEVYLTTYISTQNHRVDG